MSAIARLAALLSLLVACGGSNAPAPLRAGRTTFTPSTSSELGTLRFDGVPRALLPLDALTIGVVPSFTPSKSYDPYWLLPSSVTGLTASPIEALRWIALRPKQARAAADGSLALDLAGEGGFAGVLRVEVAGDDRLKLRFSPAPTPDGSVIVFTRLRVVSDPTEAFYGLGASLEAVNQRGKLRAMQAEVDFNIESANNEAHFPIPLLVGTSGWGLFVESRRPGLFDVGTQRSDLVEVTYGTADGSADGLTFHLYGAGRAIDVTRRYYETTSFPTLPAQWALGPWIWRNESRDQAEVLDDIERIRDLDLPTSAIWLDRPYATAVNSFDFEAARFPDPPAMIAAAHAAGLRMALWSTPYLENATGALHAEAVSRGYYPPSPGPSVVSWGLPIDFTNPAAFAYWQSLIRRYTDLGIEGFKLDYAEDITVGLAGARTAWGFADGSDERTMHYGYTPLYHRAYAELLPASGGFLLCRAGRFGGQKYVSVVWPGDLDATLTKSREVFTDRDGHSVTGVGGLPASLIYGLTLGVSGYPFYGSDTGGYRHSPPNRETYIRWFQQTALSTVMQVGDSSSQPPWVFNAENGRDEAALALYRAFARLHLRLFPYEWTYAKAIASDGRPIARAFGLVYPSLGAHPDDQYLFGDELLVAPVVKAGVTRRSVQFPPGDWVDYWTGDVIHGGASGLARDVDAPLEKLPLYLRAGAILPLLRPTIDTLSPATDPGVESYANDPGRLFVRIVPAAAPSSFTLYDGTVLTRTGGDLTSGATASTESGQPSALPSGTLPSGGVSAITMTIKTGSVFSRGARLEILRSQAPVRVTLDGVALSSVADEATLDAASQGFATSAEAGGLLLVQVPAGDHTVLVE